MQFSEQWKNINTPMMPLLGKELQIGSPNSASSWHKTILYSLEQQQNYVIYMV